MTDTFTFGTQRFPFRAAPGEEQATVNARIARALLSVDALILQLARRAFRRADPDTLEDIVQDVATHLALHALPQFDSTNGAKLSTYAHRCITRKLIDISRAHRRQLQTERLDDVEIPPAHDLAKDQALDVLAANIVRDPADYMPPTPARVLTALREHRDYKAARRALGMSEPAFWNASSAAQARCRELARDVA